MKTFNEALESFVKGCQAIVDAEYGAGKETLKIDNPNAKYIRIVRESGSVFCFVVRNDGFTKALQDVKSGDVMKPASWKTPAKDARGNIFFPDNGLSRISAYGPDYNNTWRKLDDFDNTLLANVEEMEKALDNC